MFSDELNECRLYVSATEKFMMKYTGTLLSLFYISISICLFLYSIGIIDVSFLPDFCSFKEAVKIHDSNMDAVKKCIDTCTLDTLLSKK